MRNSLPRKERARGKGQGAKAAERQAAAPASFGDTDRATRRELLRSMLLQRRFEERCAEAYALGKIGGFCHLYIGQEACGTGAISALREDDYVITTYRDHGQALARGIYAARGHGGAVRRIDGCSRGKGGLHAPLRPQPELPGRTWHRRRPRPVGTGVGFAIKYRGGDQVCLCFMGESVVNTGAFHEALNMAALVEAPRHLRHREQPLRHGHRARARVVDQRHLHARRRATTCRAVWSMGRTCSPCAPGCLEAVHRARTESMPTLLEIRTYRFMGHSMSDAVSGTYRTKEELEEYMQARPDHGTA